jgi:hypothetical protein
MSGRESSRFSLDVILPTDNDEETHVYRKRFWYAKLFHSKRRDESKKRPDSRWRSIRHINLKGAHYRSNGNLWQKIFGGSNKVSLSTQVSHIVASSTAGASNATSASIEEMRDIKVGQPYYFGSGREVALDLPTDCDAIEMTVTMSAVQSDNLSGALSILNSGELKSTLQLASPALSESLAIANVVKKLLTNTNPQNSLQADFAGRVSVNPSDDPVRDFCLVQGTLILIYRESEGDTSLDDLDPSKLTAEGDGLKYDGQAVQNTYVMFQVSFTELRGEDPSAQWFSSFSAAEQTLDGLVTASTDADKQKLWAAAYATYQQAVKLLFADPTYTQYQAKGIAATRLAALQQKYTNASGQPKSPAPAGAPQLLTLHQESFLGGVLTGDPKAVAKEYLAKLSRSSVSLPGPLR